MSGETPKQEVPAWMVDPRNWRRFTPEQMRHYALREGRWDLPARPAYTRPLSMNLE